MSSTKSQSLTLYFCFLSLLLFLSLSPSPTFAVSKLIDEVCKKTKRYTDCVAALNLDPKAESASNLHDLAKIELKLAIANSSKTLDYINQRLKHKPNAPFQSCASSYEYGIGSFKSAFGEIDEDGETANYDVKVAGDSAYECESALASARVKDSKILAGNEYVKLYSLIGFYITYDF